MQTQEPQGEQEGCRDVRTNKTEKGVGSDHEKSSWAKQRSEIYLVGIENPWRSVQGMI